MSNDLSNELNDPRIVRSPKAYLVSLPGIRSDAMDEFFSSLGVAVADRLLRYTNTMEKCEGDPDRIPELAGRICYMSFGQEAGRKSNNAYLGHILDSRHGSVLEHSNFGFILTGVSRTLTHELVRHRVGWSYSQLSQRYVDSSNIRMIMPPMLLTEAAGPPSYREHLQTEAFVSFRSAVRLYEALTEKLADQVATVENLTNFAIREGVAELHGNRNAVDSDVYILNGFIGTRKELMDKLYSSAETYKEVKKLLGTVLRKSARETARSVLPNCTETKIYCTANARALRHFFELRGSLQAEIEMRRMAVHLFRVISPHAENMFQDIEILPTPDGFGRLSVKHSKV